ncbi:MAG: fibrobacter succinogenes major paralogous domain-containing protein, partial [Ignavibacteriaceae bacterium]
MNPQEKTHLGCLIIIFFVGIILLIHVVHQDLNLLGCGDQSSYKTVKIGEQTWMLGNLNVDHYRNGDAIPEVEDPAQWGNLKTGAWCYYRNDPGNDKKYGKLYNWYAVNDPRGLAPEGWHIPTQAEFKTLGAAVN